MPASRTEVLRDFERYYTGHIDALARAAGPDAGEHFQRESLERLYDDYCADSAARLYECASRVQPHLRPGSDGPLQILDITCFATTQVFRILFPGAAVHACDKHLRWQPFLEGVECRRCDLELDPLPYADGQFDLVVFTETLEHIPRSPYAILGEIRRVLRPGGVLLFSVPNLASLSNRLKLMLGRDILSVERFYSDAFGHFREYTMGEVRHLLTESGLTPVHTEYTYHAGARPRGQGPGAALQLASRRISRTISGAVPSLRQVCLAIARKRAE